MGFPVNKTSLLLSVKQIVTKLKVTTRFKDNMPGNKWYYNFLKRHKSISTKHAEYVNKARGLVSEMSLRNWFKEVHDLLEDEDYLEVLEDPQRIFNMDESAFFLAPQGNMIIGPRGTTVYNECSNNDKENITTLFAVNAAGDFAPPLTLYKYVRLPLSLIEAEPPNWGIGKSENGWMTGKTFYEYIGNVFILFLKESKTTLPALVYLDGHKSHLTLHLSKFCEENKKENHFRTQMHF